MSKKVVANETMVMMAMMVVTVLLMIMILVFVSLVVVLCGGGGVQRWVCLFASDCLADHATTQQSIAEERMCPGHN